MANLSGKTLGMAALLIIGMVVLIAIAVVGFAVSLWVFATNIVDGNANGWSFWPIVWVTVSGAYILIFTINAGISNLISAVKGKTA